MPSLDEYKAQGNKAFLNKQYQQAIDLYSEAIALDKENPVLYSNRAQCHLNLKDWIRASNDIEVGLRLKPSDKIKEKLLFRKGLTAKGSGNKEMAKRAFAEALQLNANNTAARDELAALEAKKVKVNEQKEEDSRRLPIEVVYELPDEFKRKINGESVTIHPPTTSTSPEVDAIAEELFGNKKSLPPKVEEVPKQEPFADRPTMHHLKTLRTLPSDKKRNGYRVVLELNNTQLDEMFAYSGLDSDFFEFFLEAASYFLTSLTDFSVEQIIDKLEYMKGLKRFDLALLLCSSEHVSNLINASQVFGEPAYSRVKSLLGQ